VREDRGFAGLLKALTLDWREDDPGCLLASRREDCCSPPPITRTAHRAQFDLAASGDRLAGLDAGAFVNALKGNGGAAHGSEVYDDHLVTAAVDNIHPVETVQGLLIERSCCRSHVRGVKAANIGANSSFGMRIVNYVYVYLRKLRALPVPKSGPPTGSWIRRFGRTPDGRDRSLGRPSGWLGR
jgi:hypothetical protein